VSRISRNDRQTESAQSMYTLSLHTSEKLDSLPCRTVWPKFRYTMESFWSWVSNFFHYLFLRERSGPSIRLKSGRARRCNTNPTITTIDRDIQTSAHTQKNMESMMSCGMARKCSQKAVCVGNKLKIVRRLPSLVRQSLLAFCVVFLALHKTF